MSALFRLAPVQSRCGTSRAPLHEPPRRAGAKKQGRHEASLVLALAALATLVSLPCARSKPKAPAEPLLPIGATVSIEPPLGLPPVTIPGDNPPTAQTTALGRKLLFDKRLSLDKTIACASCHRPDAAFADPDRFSEGMDGQKGGRQAPPEMNVAYFETHFWDGRAAGLEDQAGGPVEDSVETAYTHEGVEQRLSEGPVYVELFKEA